MLKNPLKVAPIEPFLNSIIMLIENLLILQNVLTLTINNYILVLLPKFALKGFLLA